MARIDPYKHEERYLRWKREGAEIPGVSPADAVLIRKYIHDMELGRNIARSSRRGARSYVRLNTLRVRIPSLTRRFSERFDTHCLADLGEQEVLQVFSEMQQGVIRKENGQPYASVADFVKDFKGFWHWLMEARRQEGESIPDVTTYLDSRPTKPKWVYLKEEEVT